MSIIPDIDLKSKLIPFKTGKNKWSFRTEDKTNTIGIIPEDHNNFNKDISMKMIFGFDNHKTKKDCTLQDILKLIPTIKIREYTQETKLELLLSLADAFIKGVKDGAKVADLKGYQLTEFGRQIVERFKDPKKIFNTEWTHLNSEILSDPNLKSYVFNIPYIIYYTLLSTKTTNWYTLPFISDFSLKGNGYDGFTSSENVLNTLKGKNGFLDFVAPAFSVITTPTWKGMTSDSSVTYQIKFNLFNDTLDKAAMNYMFVNTLIQGNTPVQYGLFSQAPSLYDIQIEGGIRLFMCAGEFSYISKGVSRLPPDKFYTKLKIQSSSYSEKIIDHIKNEKLIRIPESYEVTLDFKSLLPNNLNNQLLQYAVTNIMELSATSGTYEMSDVINNISKQVNEAHGEAKKWYIEVDTSEEAIDKESAQMEDAFVEEWLSENEENAKISKEQEEQEEIYINDRNAERDMAEQMRQ